MLAQLGIVIGVLIGAAGVATADDGPGTAVVATVNGQEITQADLQAEYLVRRIPPERHDQFRVAVLNDLVDRQLIEEFLNSRKAPIPEAELNAQIELLKSAVEAGGSSLDDVLAKLGLTEQGLRTHLSLPLRWKAFVRRTVTDQELRTYFQAHQARFDGTQVRVRQIVISVPTDADDAAWQKALATLDGVRQSIIDGGISFEEAARRHSTSPSGKDGGDVGFVTFRGQLPREVTAAAFALPDGEVSPVIRSSFGVHLVQVSERKPGDYSLEDVREDVWKQRTQEFWQEQVAELRESARIRLVPAE